MKVFHVKRRQVRLCQEKLGLVLFVSLAVVILLGAYPGQDQGIGRSLQEPSFDIHDSGVVVLLHISSGGTDALSNYLIRQAALDPPCSCLDPPTKCRCLNRQGQPWLFNAYNTTGYVCGERAGFSGIQGCPIDHWFRTSGRDTRSMRRYMLITMVRDPVERFVSEWQSFTQEERFFKNEPRLFRRQSVELQKKGLSCYVGKELSTLSIQDFLSCSENGASNLQTRMLADMTHVDSLGLTGASHQQAMLASAKNTLEMLPFFGIYSRPNDTQKLLESAMGFRFKQHFSLDDSPLPETLLLPVSLHRLVVQANSLDLSLFQFARELFQERVKAVRSSPSNGPKSVPDNFRIIHRPDLDTDRGDSSNRPGLDLRGDSGPGSETVVDEYDVIDEGDSPVDPDHDEDEDEDEDDYDLAARGQRAHQNIHVIPRSQTSLYVEDEDDETEYDKALSNGIDMEVDKRSKVAKLTVHKRSAESKPQEDKRSTDPSTQEDSTSPDYKQDVEDVFVFMNRLTNLKQQQQQPHQLKGPQQNTKPAQPPRQQFPQNTKSFSSYASKSSPLVGLKPSGAGQKSGADSASKLYRPAFNAPKTDKMVNRMFQ